MLLRFLRIGFTLETRFRYLQAMGKSPYITNEMSRPGNANLNINFDELCDDFRIK